MSEKSTDNSQSQFILHQTLRTHRQEIHRIVWSPDGRMLASAAGNRCILIWDTSTWKIHQKLRELPLGVHCIAWAPEGKIVAAGGNGASVQASIESASVAPAVLEHKMATSDFDVFLCYNGVDKAEVKKIGLALKARGILPWLDEWELLPGQPWQRVLASQIKRNKSAAVFVGKDGIGPWQQMELEAFLREFVNRGCPVIPVLLPDAPQVPQLPIFLKGMTWVDFRKQDSDPIVRLTWSVTGKRGMHR